MKRTIALICMLLFSMALIAGCSSGSNTKSSSETTSADQTSQESTTQAKTLSAKWSVEPPAEISDGQLHATYKSFRIVESKDDGYILSLDFDFTNDSSEGKQFFNNFSNAWKAYQGGVELKWSTGAVSEKGVYDTTNNSLNIKDGATIDVERIWILRNTTDDVEIEFGYKNPPKALLVLEG